MMFDYNVLGSCFPFLFKRKQVRPEQKRLPVLEPAPFLLNLPSHIMIGLVLVICSEKLEMCLGFSIFKILGIAKTLPVGAAWNNCSSFACMLANIYSNGQEK